MPLQVTPTLVIPDAELGWRFSRSSGPGGQGVNTTDSRVELTVDLTRVLPVHLLARAQERLGSTTVTVAASEHRSQLQNREAAAERMTALLRTAVAPPPAPRRATTPSRGSKERRLEVKRQRSDLKRSRRSRPHDE
ncbi:MAG TPA: alternative ribosome rescue aminoacyl-tRNA hydrolase ArfB [Mycobacteriales bacterium]|nr:alternative ribosome rescue aminoacyl-tRNA hydrolase ArfB [Mycobacteriales bacterium]